MDDIHKLYGELGWILCWVTDDSKYADAIINIDELVNTESDMAKIEIQKLVKRIMADGKFLCDIPESIQRLIDNPNLALDMLIGNGTKQAMPTARILIQQQINPELDIVMKKLLKLRDLAGKHV